jgi:hypothetical protein
MVVVPVSRSGVPGRAVAVHGSSRFYPNGLACPDAGFCLAGFLPSANAQSSELLPIRDGHPGTPVRAHMWISSISCGSPTVCWAFGASGLSGKAPRALQIVNGRPDRLYRLPGHGRLGASDCTSATACVAVEAKQCASLCPGNVVQFDNGTPGPARPLHFAASAISCPSVTTCFVAGTPGRGAVIETVIDGRPVHNMLVQRSASPDAFACASTTSCSIFYLRGGGNPDKATIGLYTRVGRFNGRRVTSSTSVVPDISDATCLPTGCIAVGTEAVGPAHHTLGGVVYRMH